MKTSFELAVSGAQGAILGTIAPQIGMMTSTGRVSKINKKSVLIESKDGESQYIGENQYKPSVLYATLSDEQIKAISYTPEKDIGLSETLRQISKMQVNDLVDVITDVVDVKLTETAYNKDYAKLYDQYGDLDSIAKLAMIGRLLSAS